MRAILLAAILLITGCTTQVPVVYPFPDAPEVLTGYRCPAMSTLADDAKLSDIARAKVRDSASYKECSRYLEAWQDWYSSQRALYEASTADLPKTTTFLGKKLK